VIYGLDPLYTEIELAKYFADTVAIIPKELVGLVLKVDALKELLVNCWMHWTRMNDGDVSHPHRFCVKYGVRQLVNNKSQER